MQVQIDHSLLELVQGDITQQHVDAIVNAANPGLRGGGGVDGAIHRAGGPSIFEECRRIGGCPVGEARITTAGALPAEWVIHAVGPIYHDHPTRAPILLASTYLHCLEIASHHGVQRMAFPAISTGAYGYPVAEAATVALQTVLAYLQHHPDITLVRFVLFTASDLVSHEHALQQLW